MPHDTPPTRVDLISMLALIIPLYARTMVSPVSFARVTCALQVLKPASNATMIRVAAPPEAIRITSDRPLKLNDRPFPDPAIWAPRSALPPRVEYDSLLKTRPASLR